MADLQLIDCLQPELAMLERVRYFQRQLLTADDMTTDQDYFRQKLRRHNRFLHGWGSVCGLEVIAAPTAEAPWRARVDSGYALGPYGDEIWVGEPVHLDLAGCGPGTATDPCEPSLLHVRPGQGGTLYIAIKYAECLARPVLAMPAGCGCDEDACEYSRVRDSFQIECLAELPPSHEPMPPELICDLIAAHKLATCPPCPEDPWVVLARVTLPAAIDAPLANTMIDNVSFRRQLYRTALLQQQLIECCCGPRTTEPAVAADLAVVASAAVTGRRVQFVITVTNAGPSPAANVVLTDTLSVSPNTPANLTPSAFTTPVGAWTQTAMPGPFAANLGTLAPGQSVQLRFRAAVSGEGEGFQLQNTVAVTTSTTDPQPGNNSQTIPILVP
jgi:uncharacterized repeat protein (TIGR01451 family)